MIETELKYGSEKIEVAVPEKNLLEIISSNSYEQNKSETDIISEALQNPIGSARLKELVNPGESICIVIPDVTRLWQKPAVYLPHIIDELQKGGVDKENIIFLSATGTHRHQTEEEYQQLLGKDLYDRFEVIGHNSTAEDNLVYLGETTFGTPISINQQALESDHIILTGGIVYHLLAGWAGGRKSILPGIASYESVMSNHALSLNPNLGDSINPKVTSGNIVNNPIHQDMVEAASFVQPTFMFNVIMGSNGDITNAVAGHYLKAHEKGRKLVDELDGVSIDQKADLAIISGGGYPKDLNLYQSSKALFNAKKAVKKEGTIILLSQCREGLGDHKGVQEMLLEYDKLLAREKALRKDYTIAKFIGYYICKVAEEFNLILVSDIDPELVKKTNIKICENIQRALEIAYEQQGEELKTYLMPQAASTLPKLD